MAKGFTYFAIDPAGRTHSRNSKRVYTHCVVYQQSKARMIEWAHKMRESDLRNARYYLDIIKHGYAPNLMDFPHYRDNKEAHARDVELAKDHLNGATTPEAYADRILSETLAKLETKDWTVWYNAGWCGRFDLAQKLANKYSDSTYAGVQILAGSTR